jgi:hypothetical protein
MRLRLIDGARNWWRQWSTRLQLVCALLTGWLFFDPGSLLAAWNMMPSAVRDVLPDRFMQAVGALLFLLNVASVFARQVKQKKLEMPDE